MSVFQPVDTALVEEVEVFNEEAEERNDNLQDSKRNGVIPREDRGGDFVVTGRCTWRCKWKTMTVDKEELVILTS